MIAKSPGTPERGCYLQFMHRALLNGLKSALLLSLFLLPLTSNRAQAEEPSPKLSAAFSQMMTRYEAVRAALAADQGAAVPDSARKLALAAWDASKLASDSAQKQLEAIARAAGRLAATSVKDIHAQRVAFTEVNRPLIALIQATPAFGQGRNLFQCGMFGGYDRWVQSSSTKNNPYMGKRMLQCGRKL